MSVNELPECLQAVYLYFEQIVTKYNQSSYQKFRKYVTDVNLHATDLYHKDAGPVSVMYHDFFFQSTIHYL